MTHIPPFLEHVALDLLSKHGRDLSRLTVVFPNKRASLFLNALLARHSGGRPLWSPHYMTISELFRQSSRRTIADPVKLVCELHRSFTAQTGIDETLDHFYGWGQLLLSDFDDLDKCMADADHVLANLRDLHEMDSTDYLTESQKEAIRRFFSTFPPDHSSLLRERFLKLWSHICAIYHDFNVRLEGQGLAYEGALYREVVERADVSTFKGGGSGAEPLYIFVGFNVLQRVEQRLFSMLKREGLARYYWDYDRYYMNSEAGQFIAQHLADFPNELDGSDADIYDCFSRPKSITVASAPTENIQARYVGQWAGGMEPASSGALPDTAIVLCDESLLPTVTHCIPGNVGKVNVTTGYPLGQTPAASLVGALFALRTQGWQPSRGRYRLRHVNALLRHPYIYGLSPQVAELHSALNRQKIYYPDSFLLCTGDVTSLLFRDVCPSAGNVALLQWMCDVLRAVATARGGGAARAKAFSIQSESLFQAYTLLNRLLALASAGDLPVDAVTLQRLSAQIMQATAIPFHGEPAEGLQVMGLLETRNLDFRRVLVLSAGEGNMPRGVSDTSFIPYSLRKAYGLTTADHKVAIFSYYFHRLLQRADDITIVYNNSTTEGRTGEMSRFVLQLLVEDRHHSIAKKTLLAAQTFTPFRPQPVEKTPAMTERLAARFTQSASAPPPLLTPTAVNRYLRCQLMFYYTYVHDLREPDTNDDDTIDNRIFGNIFHEAARLVYSRLMEKGGLLTASDIDSLLRGKADIERAVDMAIRQELFHLPPGAGGANVHPDLSGLQIINREVIVHYLRRLLAIDKSLSPFRIEGLETDVSMPLLVDVPPTAASPARQLRLHIGGRIDRLDRISCDGREQIRVIDYKTGSRVPTPLDGVEAIFRQDQLKNHSDYYLQAFLYSIIVARERPGSAVAPALLFIQHSSAEGYSPVLKFGKEHIADVTPFSGLFMERLTAVVSDIFNPSLPFAPTTDLLRCANCPYRLLCR